MKHAKLILFICLLILNIQLHAQGDGPRQLLWGPTGATTVVFKWMNMNQNVLPANILVKDSDVRIDVFPISLVHNFGLGGRFAQVMFTAIPGKVTGTLNPTSPGVPNPELSADGLADGFVSFKLGLVNQPALNVKEFVAHKHKTFSMMSYFRVWYPGSYDEDKPINLGSNRLTFELGFPMNIYLGKNPKRPTWLEIYPDIHLFTTNNSPTIVSQADETQQLPLFSLENHLSHNFTDKFWASADLRYQYGGSLKVDGEKQDNAINALGGGLTAGYQILPPLGANIFYGTVLTSPENVKSNIFKLTVLFTYVNMKKLQKSSEK